MAASINNELEKLDLTKNEATVYVALLKTGLTNVGPIVASTGLHRQLVYEALRKLSQRGLVTSLIKNNRQHFQASSPTALLKFVQAKEKIATELVPVLTSLQATQDDTLEVRTLYGQQAFFDNLRDMTESAAQTDKIMRIIGGGKDISFYEGLGKLYSDYVKLLSSLKVKKYLIAPESYTSEFKQKFAKEPGGNILKTMAVGLSAPTYTRITPEMTSIEIYAKEMVVVQIKNRAISKGYLEHFELLWKQAKLYR